MTPQDAPVVELRRYALVPGRRDEMIDVFERELVESQEATGMRLLGLFRDVADPDAFVWFRGFDDMAARHAALTAFYGGPVWAAHAPAVRATMVDTDDVLLLRPAGPAPGGATGGGLVVVAVHPAGPDLLPFVAEQALPALAAAGGAPAAWLVTEPAENTFRALPVREGESVLVTVTCFADAAAHDRHRAALAADPGWPAVAAGLAERSTGPAHEAHLVPTARSTFPTPGPAPGPARRP